MRISRVYTEQQLISGNTLTLDPDTSHYLGSVLRIRVDAVVHLFNAADGEFAARVVKVDKKSVQVHLESRQRESQPAAVQIHLALGLSRGDRMDIAIQKSTELGVTQISPIYCQYSEVKLKGDRVDNKLRHWRKIAIAAAEQSGRLDVPVINTPQLLQDWEQSVSEGQRLLLDPTGSEKLVKATDTTTINLLIGPEGGFSEQELDWGKAKEFSIVAMGKRVLRTETAPIAALAILQHLYGDM